MKSKTNWPLESKKLAIDLHSKLTIKHLDWHKLKSNHKLRAAELISAALIQLLSAGETKNITELLEQSILWLKKEINDPGCPSKN